MEDIIKSSLINSAGLFVYAKDLDFNYLYCNESFAGIANIDSPNSIIGKNDNQMPWRKQAKKFQIDDIPVMKNGESRINFTQPIYRDSKLYNVLATEAPLYDKSDNIIGIVGSYIDITGKQLINKTGYYKPEHARYYLGETFGNEYLTSKELTIFSKILLGYSTKQLSILLNLSANTIITHIKNIKRKLQVSSINEIIVTAIQHGLTHLIYLDSACELHQPTEQSIAPPSS